ncbi:hypothetical protein DFH09DRAFT_1094885 [Mycena vulgaris]|nr:hypothetical protein DFH09DRAFT_1094885 [Mycena vulgaris]
MLFGLAEGFVNMFGFEGDGDVALRKAIFDNMELLYSCMLLNPEYTHRGTDFPSFLLDIRTQASFGISPWIKPEQLSRILPGTHKAKHNFGDKIYRYNLSLAPGECFDPTLPDNNLPPTQPNSPDGGDLSRITEVLDSVGELSAADFTEEGKISEGKIDPIVEDGEPQRFQISDVSSLPEPGAAPFYGTIFKYNSRLVKIALSPQELDSSPWRPDDSWAVFFEKTVRPMVYYLHAAVTHDFTVVARKSFFGREEHAEICYWMEQVLLHCRLLLLSRSETLSPYSGGWGLPFPFSWEIPGESTAMFEILDHLCVAIDFPDVGGMELPLNKLVLVPLLCEARRACAYFKTPADYAPYNKYGGLDDSRALDPGKGNVVEGW